MRLKLHKKINLYGLSLFSDIMNLDVSVTMKKFFSAFEDFNCYKIFFLFFKIICYNRLYLHYFMPLNNIIKNHIIFLISKE